MRRPGTVAFWLTAAALVALLGLAGPAQIGLAFQDAEATPPAATPAPPAEAPPPPVESAATPAGSPATTEVVTLVVWYENDPSGEFINIYPMQVDDGQVAGRAADAEPIGRAEFPDPSVAAPSITIGETVYTGYLRFAGDVYERWIWENDEETNRPGTLVLQVAGEGGAYQDYFGTATFVSRDEGGVGGPLILALTPPIPAQPATEEAPAAEEVPATDAETTDAAPAEETGGAEGEGVAPESGTEEGGDEGTA